MGCFFMNHLKRYFIIGFVFVLITGSLFHFLYDWTGRNFFISLFVPVNESVWEHMKLIFFPILLYTLFLTLKLKKDFPPAASALCFGNLLGTFFIPVFFYTYTGILGHNIFLLDLSDFVFAAAAAFAAAYRLALSHRVRTYRPILFCLICILCICFFLFTCDPPDSIIFVDPTA